jgi:hypothetical protein
VHGSKTTNTDCIQQSSSWEANIHSTTQQIPYLLCNSKVQCRVHKNPPLAIVNPVHLHYSISSLPSPSRSSAWSLLFWFSGLHFVWIYFSHAGYMHRPSILPNLIILLMLGEMYRFRSSSLCHFIQSPITYIFPHPFVFKHLQLVLSPYCKRPKMRSVCKKLVGKPRREHTTRKMEG